jgi:protein-disulfide isomerase
MSEETTTSTPITIPTETPVRLAVSSGLHMKDLLIPISIIVAGALMGAGLYFSGPGGTVAPQVAVQPSAPAEAADTTAEIRPVTADDHIKGDINAPIKIVEFSDFECPFCKRYHEAVQTIIDSDTENQVAWVFRQFPLEQLHPVKAMAAAVASECVAELGGNEAFWTFTDGYFRDTLTNNRTDIETLIPKLVQEAGVAQGPFTSCFESGKYTDKIEADVAEAFATGGRGTPWSILIGPTGKTYPINGAQPVQAIQQLIQLALQEA